jgi:hypothetical protein
MLSQSKIPNVKSLRKLAFTDTRRFPLLASISRTFKNVDIIRSLYTAYLGWSEGNREVYTDFSAPVFKRMVRHKGEQVIAAKLLAFRKNDKDNNAFSTLQDMIRCYDTVKVCIFDFDKNYSIDELHLYLADLVVKTERENRTIAYGPGQRALEMCDGKYFIRLVQDTHDLFRVGHEMRICAGSYADMAAARECTVLVLQKYKDPAPAGCIEVRDSAVVQAKGPGNKLLRDRELEFVINWANDKGLNIGTGDLRLERAADALP